MSRPEPGKVPNAGGVRGAVPTAAPRYEARGCWRCLDGRVYESSVPTERWVPCHTCGGSGEKSVYVYAKKGRRS